MAQLRGSTEIWNAHSLTTGDKSTLVEIGPGPWVSVIIENTGSASATFAVEVAASTSLEAGRNALDSTPDGGLTWVPYTTKDATSETFSFVIAAGASQCIDLSPFAPQFIRLHCTAATAGATVTAFITAYGPN